MLLGGLWHGAGWTFISWGGLHGLYLIANHGWLALRQRLGQDPERIDDGRAGVCASCHIRCHHVVAWVFFRATSLDDALAILRGMVGLNGVSIPATLATYLAPPIKAALDHWGVAFPLWRLAPGIPILVDSRAPAPRDARAEHAGNPRPVPAGAQLPRRSKIGAPLLATHARMGGIRRHTDCMRPAFAHAGQ